MFLSVITLYFCSIPFGPFSYVSFVSFLLRRLLPVGMHYSGHCFIYSSCIFVVLFLQWIHCLVDDCFYFSIDQHKELLINRQSNSNMNDRPTIKWELLVMAILNVEAMNKKWKQSASIVEWQAVFSLFCFVDVCFMFIQPGSLLFIDVLIDI